MKKIIAVSFIVLVLLTSCNFPTKNAATPANDAASIVATRVAETLAVGATSTIALPAGTQPANSLPTPVDATATPTATVTSTPTATPQADPKTSLGTAAYFNTFTGGSDFGLSSPYVDEAINLSVHDGVMAFVSLGLNYGRRYQLTYPKTKDFYVEGTFQTVNCSGYDHYGLVTRAPNYTDGFGYYIGFSCNGAYMVEKWDSGGLGTIISWTADSHILAGPGQTNRIGVWMKGNEIKLYANGNLIKEFTDSTITTAGHYGIYGGAVDSGTFSFNVAEISQWNLP
jgi:hypothetical protein